MTERFVIPHARAVIRGLTLLSLVAVGWAQTLEVEPVAVSRGSANIFRMVLKPRADRPVTAIQWEFLYPGSLDIEPAGVVTSGLADAAGKSVACAVRPPRESNHVMACVLAGGVEPMAEGTIVIVRFVAGGDAPRGKAMVRVEKIAAASRSLEHLTIESLKVQVTIR